MSIPTTSQRKIIPANQIGTPVKPSSPASHVKTTPPKSPVSLIPSSHSAPSLPRLKQAATSSPPSSPLISGKSPLSTSPTSQTLPSTTSPLSEPKTPAKDPPKPFTFKSTNTSPFGQSNLRSSSTTTLSLRKPNPHPTNPHLPNPVSFRFTRKPKLDDFILHHLIGSGHFGYVYLAQHKPTGYYFAMKILNKKKIAGDLQASHVADERALQLKVSHPCICRLFETMQDADRLFLIFELCLGGDFFGLRTDREKELLPDSAPIDATVPILTPTEMRFYAAQLVCALDRIHRDDMVYRDLKPENVLIDGDGSAKLSDFGFAKILTDLTFTLCGTPEYLAPELVLGTGHDKGVDWWALGVFIYEMMVGHPPFYGDMRWMYEAIVKYKPPMKGNFDTQRPGESDEDFALRQAAGDLILGLMRKDKTKRLGCMHGGTNDVKAHPFFAGVDWEKLEKGTAKPPITSRGTRNPMDFPVHVPDDPRVLDPPQEEVPAQVLAEALEALKDF